MLYKFSIELSDVDRGVYQTLDFRVAQHPSEIATYLLTRVFAYVLNYEDGLEFSGAGLSDPDVPAMKKIITNGAVDLWIEIGNPSSKKLHKAAKTANRVVIYTYKSAEVLISDIQNNDVHRSQDLEIYAIDSKFLGSVEKYLEKNNRWSVLVQQGVLDLGLDLKTGKENFTTEIKRYWVKK
jgi:uncharacterized protein YaeQ